MTAEPLTIEPDDPSEISTLYAQTISSIMQLLADGGGTPVGEIAQHVWAGLNTQERADAIGELVANYVLRVQRETAEKVYRREAENPAVTSYVTGDDILSLLDSVHDATGGPDEAVVNRKALMNLLCEDELLRHRLDMARGESAQD